MGRREFIAFLGGAGATWSLVASAQGPSPTRRIGVLIGQAENDPDIQLQLTALQHGLRELGWTIGRNL